MATKEKRRTSGSSTRHSSAAKRRSTVKRGSTQRTAPQASAAQRSAQRSQDSLQRKRAQRAESQVVYTPPKSFNKFRFLLGLVTVVAVVLALTLGMSIFFKVENITVSGMHKYTAWDIREASGIQEGDNLLTLSKARVSGKIITNLPYVNQVRIGIKLPDTVNIEITELEVVYSIQAEDDSWWTMNAQGRVLEKISGIVAENYTRILGVTIAVPVSGQQAVASSPQADPSMDTAADGETAAPVAPLDTVNASEQLSMALNIAQLLEENGIIGEVTSVDVSDLFELTMWYENRYHVLLGEGTQLPYKIRAMKQAVAQMSDYQQGTLDVSFEVWQDKAGYTPFEE